MTPDKEREAFEQAMNASRFFPAELCFARTKSPSGRDEYVNSHLQSCWLGWQSRAALSQQAERDKRDGWTSVEDRLPESEGEYIVAFEYDGKPYVRPLHWQCHGWKELDADGYFEPIYSAAIAHWMPLPPPPSNDAALAADKEKS